MIVRDLEAPAHVLRSLAAHQPERYPVLLESTAEGPLGRFSVLMAEPSGALWCDAGGRVGAAAVPPAVPGGGGFLDALGRWWEAERCLEAGLPHPFHGGWAVFLAYEIAAEIEPRLTLPPAAFPWRAFALRIPCALVHDRLQGKTRLIAEPSAAGSIGRIEADVRAAARGGDADTGGPLGLADIEEEPPEAYLERVRRAKAYIAAGDIYQTNLSRPWRAHLPHGCGIGALYERLCAANPAPFAALAQWRGGAILSSSPERLLRVAGSRIDTRPIAGTRPRSRRPGEDGSEMAALSGHPKERAEHIMLIDLERNDLGRVCEPGTVRVDELMSIESYAHVHHIVSNVSGLLRAGTTPIDALRAVFPGGTITGCPKVRCMQIIAELEREGRGAYTGSLGWLGRDGSLDFNILIRTFCVSGGALEVRAGAGIVADSDPARELEETRAKARGLLAALERSAP